LRRQSRRRRAAARAIRDKLPAIFFTASVSAALVDRCLIAEYFPENFNR
jgi:hypothetical protein